MNSVWYMRVEVRETTMRKGQRNMTGPRWHTVGVGGCSKHAAMEGRRNRESPAEALATQQQLSRGQGTCPYYMVCCWAAPTCITHISIVPHDHWRGAVS